MEKNKEKKFIVLLFAGTLFLRILYLILNLNLISQDIRVNPDSHNYHTIAKNILQGFGFSHTPPYPTSFVEPVYPLFLSFIYSVWGENIIFVILIQILIDCFSCILVYLLTKELINSDVATLSGIIYSIYPDFICSSCEIMTETLFLFFEIITLFLILKARKENNKLLFGISGIFSAIAVLTRGTFLPFPFLLFFYLKKNLKKYLIFLIFFFIFLSPWIVRNYFVHKDFIIVGTRAGLSFWMANNEKAGGRWIPIPKKTIFKEFNRMPTEVELNRLGYKKGWEYLKKLNVKELLILEIKKFLYLFDFKNEDGGIMYWYIFLLPFALSGIFINYFSYGKNSILYYPIITSIIVSLIFGSHIRLRIPFLPFLNIFSAIGINYLFEKHFNFSQNKS